MDYGKWVQDLQQFFGSLPRLTGRVEHRCSVAPPLDPAGVGSLDRTVRLPPPRPIKEFLTQASGSCQSRYYWQPSGRPAELLWGVAGQRDVYGGTGLCDAGRFGQWQEWCAEGADTLAQGDQERSLWLRCFPFAFVEVGDFLALDTGAGSGDPPVVYLCHDDHSRLLSPCFADFLRKWQQLCYVGPEIWLLGRFLDPQTGHLSGLSPRGQTLRDLLRPGRV